MNSFGYGGSNAHAIIDEPNAHLNRAGSTHVSSFASKRSDLFWEDDIQTRPHVLVFSANDASSLKSYVSSIDKHLADPRVNIKIRDLAYTLSEKRSRHFHRGYLSTKQGKLDRLPLVIGETLPTAPLIGLVFNGQGGQWSEMGKELLIHFPLAKAAIQRLDDVLQSLIDAPKWLL